MQGNQQKRGKIRKPISFLENHFFFCSKMPQNTLFLSLVKTLSKYDDNRWLYLGSNSEGYEQKLKHSFNMEFGGGGFAVGHSLARVLAGVLDSCLMRYAHLYGSDGRIFSCLAALGVGLTH